MFRSKSAAYSIINSVKPSRSSSLCPLYKNILCLIIGLIIGIRFTDIWFDIQNVTSSAADKILSNNELLPEYLFNNTRVLCWIMTNPNNHLKKAIHVRHTWGKRCNKLLFMSTEEDEVLQSIKLTVDEGRKNLWNKTQEALKYIYDHHMDDAEWFLKADDDTYVIMENLRLFLYPFPSDAPLYFGAKFKPYVKQGYMSGGAGYVLSKETVRKYATEGYHNTSLCPHKYQSEDLQLGLCLENIGVIAGDTRDEEGNERFLPFAPDYFLPEVKKSWYQNYTYYPLKDNKTCCSSSVISFHYIKGQQFYVLDYLLYILRPFGILANSSYSLPLKLDLSDIVGSSTNVSITPTTES